MNGCVLIVMLIAFAQATSHRRKEDSDILETPLDHKVFTNINTLVKDFMKWAKKGPPAWLRRSRFRVSSSYKSLPGTA